MPTSRSTYVCPHCAQPVTTEVYDSRPWNGYFRRRRKCNACQSKFTTIEVPEEIFHMTDHTARSASAVAALNDFIQKFNLLRKDIRASAREENRT